MCGIEHNAIPKFIISPLSIVLFRQSVENITNIQSDDDSGKYLNSISNNSNSSPELIEYYDVDESLAPDPIYPDPDSIFQQNLAEHRPFDEFDGSKSHRNSFNKNGATKFNKLKEVNNPDGMDELRRTTTVETITDASDGDKTFKGKSIDFNIRHTMEELRNEDLRDHDIIDNIMYIYYGSNVALRKSLGGSIIIVGTVFALAAQILAIIFTLLRNR